MISEARTKRSLVDAFSPLSDTRKRSRVGQIDGNSNLSNRVAGGFDAALGGRVSSRPPLSGDHVALCGAGKRKKKSKRKKKKKKNS
jgi:hypothetical protein